MSTEQQIARLHLDSWAGRQMQRVEVIKVGPKRTTIRAITRTRLAGNRRFLEPGETTTVPTWALEGVNNGKT